MKYSFRRELDDQEMSDIINELSNKFVGLTFQDDKYRIFMVNGLSIITKGKTNYWSLTYSPMSDNGLVHSLVKYTISIDDFINSKFKYEKL